MNDWRQRAIRGDIMPNKIAEDVGNTILAMSSTDDMPFLRRFVTTQMFTQYIEVNSEIQF
jgi:hypothetical protein